MEISGERNWSTQTAAYYPVLLLNIQCYSYLVEDIAKKQHWTFSPIQNFQWNLVNSKYILHMIIAYIAETISVCVCVSLSLCVCVCDLLVSFSMNIFCIYFHFYLYVFFKIYLSRVLQKIDSHCIAHSTNWSILFK